MPDNKMSLENILDEYSPGSSEPKTSVGRVDAQKIINSTVEAPELGPRERQKITLTDEKSSLFDGALRQAEPANEYKPADLSRQRISVVGKDAAAEVRSTTVRKPEGQYAEPSAGIDLDETLKIRRMSHSTRAKEVSDRKSGKRHCDRDECCECLVHLLFLVS